MSLKVPREWWREFFDQDYLKIYKKQDLVRAPGEVEGILKILNLPKGSRIMDLCCGYGRHSIPLAKSGFEVTGLDLSETLLRRAKKDSRKEGVKIRWRKGDMREIPFENEFDGVINIFTAFGYFEEDRENFKVIRGVSKSLKKGGKFLMDTVNREWIIRNFLDQGWEQIKRGTFALDERELDLSRSRIRARTLLIGGDKEREKSHSLRLYTLKEMIQMMEESGLHLLSVFGRLDGSEYNLDSKRMVILTEKRRNP